MKSKFYHSKLNALIKFPLIAILFSGTVIVDLNAQGCNNLAMSVSPTTNCCFRLTAINTTECIPSMRVILTPGVFTSFTVNTGGGFSAVQLAPNEYEITHINPFIPLGTSFPAVFCIPPGISPNLAILYDYVCGEPVSCEQNLALKSCPITEDTCVCLSKKYTLTLTQLHSGKPFVIGSNPSLIDCPPSDIIISGFYGCVLPGSQDPCDETPVSYLVSGPNGVILSGITTNYPSISIPVSSVSTNGLYKIKLSTLCPGMKDSCMHEFAWVVECDTCKCDPNQFNSISYRPFVGAPNQSAKCGDTLSANCKSSVNWTLSGNFQCSGFNCNPQSMTAKLVKPDGSSVSIAVNWNLSNFNLSISPGDLSSSGFYHLSIQATCGNSICICEFVICATCCLEDFEDESIGSQGQWLANNGLVKVIGNAPGNTTHVLRGDDGNNVSWMYNTSEYNGNWINKYPGCFCFDIRYDANDPNNPQIGYGTLNIYSGASLNTGLRAYFEFAPGVGNNWQKVCAPITKATTALPSNSTGQWKMVNSTSPIADFNTLITGVAGIAFILDFAGGSAPSEILYLDNICIEKCPISTGTNPVISVDYIFNIFPNPTTGDFIFEWSSGQTQIDRLNIIDITGRNICTQFIDKNVSQSNVNISGISNGIYFVELISQGRLLASRKLIKN